MVAGSQRRILERRKEVFVVSYGTIWERCLLLLAVRQVSVPAFGSPVTELQELDLGQGDNRAIG